MANDQEIPLAARRLQDARWQAVLDTVQDAVISIDPVGKIKLFNRGAERIFGYRADEVLERDVAVLMPRPYCDEHDRYLADYKKTGVAKAIGQIRSVHALRQNGDVFPIELSVSEAQFEGETVYMAIIRDVSERERSAQALGASEARNQAIVEAALDGIITIDEHGLVESFNPAAARLFGYRPEEVIGLNVKVLMPEPFASEHDGYLSNFLRTGEKKIIGIGRDVVGRRRDGSTFPMHLSVSEVQLQARRLFTGLVQDITERLGVQTKLREMERAGLERQRLADIGAITAQIVHDLGNPLAAISMQGQLIVRRGRRDPNQPIGTVLKAAEQIVERVSHLDALIHEFLDFAREQRLTLIAFEVSSFLREIVDLWRPLATERGIVLHLEPNRENYRLVGDEEKLRRVFENLIKNAVEAIGRGPGSITIRATVSNGDNIRISIVDTGPGIPKDVDVFRLFETTKANGTGLGLPIARQIVMAHAGGIEVADVDPHGAAFHIDLPGSRSEE